MWDCKSKWRWKASGVAGRCCGVWYGGDVDAGGDVDGGRYGDDQTCAGFCDGGGVDCCEVGVGMVVVVLVSGLSVVGSGGAVAGGADAMEGDGDGWEPVAELVTWGAGAVGANGVGCGIGG